MRLPRTGLAVMLGVFALDQAIKYAVTGPLGLDALSEGRDLLPVFTLRFVANQGVSLGLLHADSDTMRWALVALTLAIAGCVFAWMWRERNRADQAALGLVAGGALGNIVDRVRLGWVVDYADLHFGGWHPFLVFNLADAAITVGVLVLLVRALLTRDRKPLENANA